MRAQKLSNQVFIGLVFLLIGLALLFRNLGFVNFSGLGRWIPAIFILLGVWQLIANGFRYVTGPLILVVGGSLFQLVAWDVLSVRSLFDWWPLILILIGGSMLWERSGFDWPDPSARSGFTDRVNLLAVFNDPKAVVTSSTFQGGELTALAGGIELDLHAIDRPEQSLRLDVFAMLGGIEIRVPPDWSIKSEVIGILGGLDDERDNRPPVSGQQPDLIVSGFAILGGITIKEQSAKGTS